MNTPQTHLREKSVIKWGLKIGPKSNQFEQQQMLLSLIDEAYQAGAEEMREKAIQKILVIAGNKRQFDDWLRSFVVVEPDIFVYADAHSIMGCRFSAVLKVGTYYENPNYDNIRNMVDYYFENTNFF